ncbi:MAG TPA: carbohydrate kinase family protein [Rubrobacter sp.]|nr:carbohydrate kinase family protein [Rubrobacter sp.]
MSRISIIGNVNIDLLVWPAAALPPPGAEVQVETIGMRAAGSAGNSALALARLGHVPRLAGCVGDDHFGRYILEELAAAGIDEGVTTLPGEPTGITIAFQAPGRDRSFLTLLGSLESFGAKIIPVETLATDFVLLCGYFTLPALRGEPALDLLQRVRAEGGRTFFDSDWDPGGWSQESREEITTLLPLVDVFLPSEDEARGLTGVDDPEAAARRLQQVSGGRVVLKLGPEGCVAFGPGDEHRVPAPPVRVSDTTGAGDSFNGGLMYALSTGAEWSEALRFATRLASTVVSRSSENRYPTLDEVIPQA